MFLVFYPSDTYIKKETPVTQHVIKSYLFQGLIIYLIKPNEIIFKKASAMKITIIP